MEVWIQFYLNVLTLNIFMLSLHSHQITIQKSLILFQKYPNFIQAMYSPGTIWNILYGTRSLSWLYPMNFSDMLASASCSMIQRSSLFTPQQIQKRDVIFMLSIPSIIMVILIISLIKMLKMTFILIILWKLFWIMNVQDIPSLISL